jgi:hypothetical protein
MKYSAHPGTTARAITGVALLLMLATLAGCAGESGARTGVPAGGVAVQNVNDDIGTILIPPRGSAALPTPGAVAELLAANRVQIRWSPQPALYAREVRNGREISVVPSTDGLLPRRQPKPARRSTRMSLFLRGVGGTGGGLHACHHRPSGRIPAVRPATNE